MLMRSGFFTRPRPLVEFDCGSQSTRSVLTSAAASEAARLMAVVVLPTPPFWLATAMTRPMILFLCVARQDMRSDLRNQCLILVQLRRVFHVEHSARLPSTVARTSSSVSRETLRGFAYWELRKIRLALLQCGEVFHAQPSCELVS